MVFYINAMMVSYVIKNAENSHKIKEFRYKFLDIADENDYK